MGCGNSKEQTALDLETQIRRNNMGGLIDGIRFENEMEKQIFMAVNLIRFCPKQFVTAVMQVKKNNPMAKSVNGTHQLCKHMSNMPKLPPLRWDEQAARACREQNMEIQALQQFPDGGQMGRYSAFIGSPVNCEEFTLRRNDGNSGIQFVCLQMIMNWGRNGPGQHKSAVLEPLTTAMGINVSLSQFHTNISNALYVKGGAARIAQVAAPIEQRHVQPVMVQAAPQVIIQHSRVGLLKLKLQMANLQHHSGPPLMRMSPKIRFFIGDFEWVSSPQEHGGHTVKWGPLARFEYRIRDPLMMVRIEVLDHKGLMNNEPIGHCEVKIGDFIDRRECAFELFFRGMPAGQVMFHSEFMPEAEGVAMMGAPMMAPPMAVEMQQPMMQQPMMAPPMAVEMQQPMGMMGRARGVAKAHLKHCHLKHHEGPPLERMSPKVRFFIGDFEWVSVPKEHGGHNPEWGPFASFEYRIMDPEQRVRIEVLDHMGLMNNEPIGGCDVRVGDFMDKMEPVFELFFRGMPAGQIFFHSEFIMEVSDPMMAPPMAVEMQQPMMQQPMMQEPMMAAPMAMVDPMMGRARGLAKAHLKHCHLQHHEGPPLERMSPKVRFFIGDFEWVSVPKENGGHNPEWGPFASFEYRIMDPEQMVRIEVLDHMGLMNNEPIGCCDVRVGDFMDKMEPVFELFFRGMPAGQIFFHSEFIMEVSDPMMAPPMAVEMQQPMMQQPMMQEPMAMVDPMMAAPMMMEGGRPGWLKMHLKEVHVEFHAGPPLERMSPQVVIRMGEFEWKSKPKHHEGHKAHWDFEQMDMEVFDHHREVVIEVRDHEGMMENPALGIHRCEVGFFATRGEWEDWLPLRLGEFPAGRIHFKTEFKPN